MIRELRSTDIHAELELADAKPGERTFDLTAQQIRHQRGLHVCKWSRARSISVFDTRLTREVDIRPRVTGNFVEGEQIVKVLVDPERIMITDRSSTWRRWTRPQRIQWMLPNSYSGYLCDECVRCRSSGASGFSQPRCG